MTKKQTLNYLKNTYCRLKPSKIEGVGVFAVKNIPKNTNPFQGAIKHKWLEFLPKELKNLDKEILKMISDFFATEKNGKFVIPESGLNCMDISFFLNKSKKTNVKTIDNGLTFITLRKIKKGEELTVSYADYDDRYKN